MLSPFGIEHGEISKGIVGILAYGGSGKKLNVGEKFMHAVSTAKKAKAGGVQGTVRMARQAKNTAAAGAQRDLERFNRHAEANKKLIATPLRDRPR